MSERLSTPYATYHERCSERGDIIEEFYVVGEMIAVGIVPPRR
jgi:hypothetical protein